MPWLYVHVEVRIKFVYYTEVHFYLNNNTVLLQLRTYPVVHLFHISMRLHIFSVSPHKWFTLLVQLLERCTLFYMPWLMGRPTHNLPIWLLLKYPDSKSYCAHYYIRIAFRTLNDLHAPFSHIVQQHVWYSLSFAFRSSYIYNVL